VKFQEHPLRSVLIFMFITAVASSCTPLPVTDDKTGSQKWEMHRDELMLLEKWNLSGRIAVKIENDSGTASLHWTQDKQQYQMRIIAPFGKGTFVLTGNDNKAELRSPDNTASRAHDAETLLQKYMGWSVPVSALIYWIRGCPDPSLQTDALSFDEKHVLSYLEQSNWRIRYKKYTEIDGRLMPNRLDLENPPIRVRISVKKWDFE